MTAYAAGSWGVVRNCRYKAVANAVQLAENMRQKCSNSSNVLMRSKKKLYMAFCIREKLYRTCHLLLSFLPSYIYYPIEYAKIYNDDNLGVSVFDLPMTAMYTWSAAGMLREYV